VTLNVSKGQERYLIPMDLKGKDINAATTELQALTLTVANQPNQVYNEKIPAGKVVSTTPAEGTKVKRNSQVVLNVSQGPKPIVVPPIAGVDIKAATLRLTKLGLVVKVATQIYDSSPVGNIISSDPVPGTTVKKGDVISVTVSKGPPPVQVPNVVGMDVSTAK
jgi:serine/threonine-protein kinase